MRNTPSDSNESMRNEYDRLLQQSIKAAKEYETMSGDEDDEDYDGDNREMAADHLEHLLSKRVDLLKKLEGLQSIDEAFPLVKVASEPEREKIDAADLIRKFLSGGVSEAEMRAAGKAIVGPERPELTEEQLRDFRKVCQELAERNGFTLQEESGAWITLAKADMRFSLKHFAFPSGFGMFGDSRISMMQSWRDAKDQRNVESGISFDDGQLVSACTDEEMQREIDRLVAVFK